jgi:hypothetical protein
VLEGGKAGNQTVTKSFRGLERAIAQRQPTPGLVHHSDRGLQYASDEYVRVLQAHQMIPSMSVQRTHTYWLLTDGYDSGEQILRGGNIEIVADRN